MPAYSIYEDALAHIEKISMDEILDLLTEKVDRRLREEAYEDAADAYNKQAVQEREGDIPEQIDKPQMLLTQKISVFVPTRGRREHS